MDEDITMEDLQEIRDRGMSPKASKELVDFYNELLQLIHRVHDQAENLAQIYRDMESYEVGGLFDQLSNELEDFLINGKQLDLGHTYDFEELNHFYRKFYDYVNNDLMHYTRWLQDRGALTDNVEESVKYLVYAGDEFRNFVERENYRNEQLMNNLNQVESVQAQAPQFDTVSQELKIEKPEQQREMKAMDVVQGPTDDKRKLPEENADSGRAAPTMDSVKKAIQKYTDAVERKNFHDVSRSFVELVKEINAAEKAGVIQKDLADEMRRPLREVQSGAYSVRLHQNAVQSLNETVGEKQQKQEQQREMQSQDIVQSSADDKRKLEEEKAKQDKKLDKQDIKQQPQQPKKQKSIKTHEESIAALQRIDKMVDRQHSDESFKNMMHGLKDLADKKLVSKENVDAYRAIFNEVKENHNTENGILKLSSELNVQMQEMRDADKKAREKADKQPKLQPRDGDYLGFGKIKGREQPVENHQESKQMDSFARTNKLKDGIVKVLNKREEKMRAEQREQEQQQQNDKAMREKMLIKKLFGKGNTAE